MVDLNVAAVTGAFDGGENWKPGRILNMYLVPPAVGVGPTPPPPGTMCRSSRGGLVRVGDEIRARRVKDREVQVERRVEKPEVALGGEVGGAAGRRRARGSSATATHTRPPANASASGVPPTRVVESSFGERGSSRMTVPSPEFATQIAAGVATRAAGALPTCVVPTTAFVSGSTRTTVSSPAFAIHAPAWLTAIAAGPWPAGIKVVSRVDGSIFVTVPSELFATQTSLRPLRSRTDRSRRSPSP